MSIDRICFFIQIPLSQKDYKRFGVEILKSKGFDVLFLDLTRLVNPDYIENYQVSDVIEDSFVKIMHSRAEVVNFLKSHQRDMFGIDLIGLNYDLIFFYRILKRLNIQYATFCANTIPSPKEPSIKIYKRIFRFMSMNLERKKLSICNKFTAIIDKLPSFISGLQHPKLVLVNGLKYEKRSPRPVRNSETIWAHTLDYDLYLSGAGAPIINGKYCVFLDEYFPAHPDFLLKGTHKISIDPNKYYKGINCFFNYIEDKLNISVVIAAHPRSQYEFHGDLFNGRRVIKGKTINLVAHSRVVLTHGSTSINFAVLYKKPIIFTTFNQIKNSYYSSLIWNFAAQFNKKPINIDKKFPSNIQSELVIDEKSYSAYISNYIKRPGTPEKPFWDIVADYISKS